MYTINTHPQADFAHFVFLFSRFLDSAGRSFFFRTRVERVWCAVKDCFIQNHIVTKVDTNVVIEEGTKSILFGDIVLKLNGKELVAIDSDKLYKLFHPKKNKVMMLELSVLRRRDLAETLHA